mmetsp:Transcript_22320/g.63901  ORF Transcript_22320/g.63901 Transcript_22320/m.63901 type:complete len:220 (-) Transcript_22320:1548-2207(-)
MSCCAKNARTSCSVELNGRPRKRTAAQPLSADVPVPSPPAAVLSVPSTAVAAPAAEVAACAVAPNKAAVAPASPEPCPCHAPGKPPGNGQPPEPQNKGGANGGQAGIAAASVAASIALMPPAEPPSPDVGATELCAACVAMAATAAVHALSVPATPCEPIGGHGGINALGFGHELPTPGAGVPQSLGVFKIRPVEIMSAAVFVGPGLARRCSMLSRSRL